MSVCHVGPPSDGFLEHDFRILQLSFGVENVSQIAERLCRIYCQSRLEQSFLIFPVRVSCDSSEPGRQEEDQKAETCEARLEPGEPPSPQRHQEAVAQRGQVEQSLGHHEANIEKYICGGEERQDYEG